MTLRLLVVFVIVGCENESASEAAPAAVPAPVASDVPAAVPVEEAPVHPNTSGNRLAASHILIEYAGAMNTLPTTKRTREEARALAESIQKRAVAGENFAKLAETTSEDSSKSRGGSLGSFDKGTMVAAFEEALLQLSVGGISPVVESPFGFHVIKREAMNQVHCAQLIVSFVGSARPVEAVTRTKEEAQARIAAAKAELDAGTDWDVVVRKYSDGPAKDDRGDLGWFSRRQLMPALDEAAFALDIGQTSPVVESPVGFHLVYRME